MWTKESNENKSREPRRYKYRKENFYFNIQLIFSLIILIVSFALKYSDDYIFAYTKENYTEFFETDKFIENSFSYNSFVENIYNELQVRFGELITVFNNFTAKGSADIYPNNVSNKKYVIDEKGIIPVKGYISSPYGIRTNPFNKKEKEFHTGLDIAAPEGSFIRCAFEGVVTKAEYNSKAGNHIRILSENGIETLYAHNQFNFVKTGDTVLSGQVIASVGETGNATGPHLHFEFIANGIRYNPAYVLDI